MPNPFSITTATETIPLDAQGRGSTTFTVSNISRQLRRGRARLVPADPGQASWLSVDGEAERNFPADGTQQYTVRVAVPPGAPAGRYTFGLDVVSVENPDEEWSQGPQVRFEVAPAPPPKKPFPWWIVAVVLAVLLVGGLILWLVLKNRHVEVGIGETCDPGKPECAANLTCVQTGGHGICVGKAGFSPCDSDRACADGLSCQAGTCRGRLRFSPCSQDGECEEGLACVAGACLGAPRFQGCASADDCAKGLVCQGNTCMGPLHFATCKTTDECLPGLDCANGSCLFAPGTACANGADCSTGRCEMRWKEIPPAIGIGPPQRIPEGLFCQ